MYAYMFAMYVKGANIEKCRKACEGTKHAFTNPKLENNKPDI